MPVAQKTLLIPFQKLGEYRLHYHSIQPDETLGPAVPFNCAIRNREHLLTERIELHPGEELHSGPIDTEESPLLRYNGQTLFVYIPQTQIWWPARGLTVSISLDSISFPRVFSE